MLQHVADDVGQVFLCHNLLFIAQFCDALRHTARLFRSQFQPQFLKVSGNISPTAVLAQGIFAFTSETFRDEFVVIQLVLGVTIGMNTCYLRKHILTDDRLIRRDGNTAEALDHA